MLYVVGFVFTSDHQHVALIRKERPKWQAGRLNGIGGKIEPGETHLEAMVREFEEETGVRIEAADWQHSLHMAGEWGQVFFYKAVTDRVREVQSMTDEQVGLYRVDRIHDEETIFNLRWLIPMALDPHLDRPAYVTEPGGFRWPTVELAREAGRRDFTKGHGLSHGDPGRRTLAMLDPRFEELRAAWVAGWQEARAAHRAEPDQEK